MSPRVLVLGGGGFIGRRIVTRLCREATGRIVAAGRRAPRNSDPGVESVALDATDARVVANGIADATAVVNCITGDPHTIVESARVLFEAAARCPRPPRIVHLSSMAVYGKQTGEMDESAPLRPDLNEYGAAKVAAEGFASRYAHAVSLRPGIVYGPDSPLWSGYIARLLMSGRLGDLGDEARGICNLVHVDDVAGAVVRSLSAANVTGKAFNLSMASPPTWNEYFCLYAHALGATPVKRISRTRLQWETKVLAPLLKVAEVASRRSARVPPPIRPWLLELCRHSITLRSAAAEQALGVAWTPLQQGLAATAAWYLGTGTGPPAT
ncbi:MAG TPA: NAD-dependent epimerase/dehydratase family protein [Steroidobacteraceae bacterium]|nr:NAD-dependent epimerase/dehydratase family protein [Steroidobacteraceae bacterium]